MSIIMAYKRNDTIYMATDTRYIMGGIKRNELNEGSRKIQILDNGMVIAITGNHKTRQIIFSYPEIFTLTNAKKLTKRHIVNGIIPELIDILKEHNLLKREIDEGVFAKMDCTIILAYKNQMFEISKTFNTITYNDFQSLGDCSDLSQIILYNIKEEDDINQKFIEILDLTSKSSQYVGKPYLLVDTKELKYNFVKE